MTAYLYLFLVTPVIIGTNAQSDWRQIYSELPKQPTLQTNTSNKRWLDGPDPDTLDKDYEKGTIWPKPQHEERPDNVFFTFDPATFEFNTSRKHWILSKAFARYKELTFPNMNISADTSLPLITSIQVNVTDVNQPLSMESNESYKLHIMAPTTLLMAESVWGALRGLETFSQAVYRNGSTYRASANIIKDYPRFKYRGFLLDTARHFLPKVTIFQFLDALAYSKFNVLHWHIVDDQSFPYVSKKFPQLHKKGAFNPITHVYNRSDVRDIIKYAKLRGIRVIPEFDTPGHTHSWGGVPNLLTKCASTSGVMNPIRNTTYKFLSDFFKEVTSVFEDEYIHLGGDEVKLECWMNSSEIQHWLNKNGPKIVNGGTTLYTRFMKRLVEIVSGLKKKYIVWQDVFDDGVKIDEEAVINVWKEWELDSRSKVTAAGYKTIDSSCWYLDHHDYGLDWIKRYACDPQQFNGTETQKQLVIGGSAAVWGEYIDATNLIQYSFGRGFAVAERLWSDKNVTNVKEAMPRIREHHCRYLNRGIPAEPVTLATFCRNEWNQHT